MSAEQMIPYQVTSIPTEKLANRSWVVSVNDQVIEDVRSAQLSHPGMRIELRYGQKPEGYDGISIREPGGAATIPYMITQDGCIYVGEVTEYRPTMGEPMTNNIPRGFSDFKADGTKETSEETAVRELQEETGLQALGSAMIKLIEGQNPNSTFFDYSHHRDEGVAFFALPVTQDSLEMLYSDTGEPYYTFPATIRAQAEGDKAAERILGSTFVPLHEALKSRDMFTSAAAGQLLAHLLMKGEYLVPQNEGILHETNTDRAL